MSDPNDLSAFLDHAWQRLSRGVADSHSPARYPVIATVSPDGWPEARTVALRRASRSDGVVEVHTDSASAKITALRESPKVQLHIWDDEPRLQIRLFASVSILTGTEVESLWTRVPDASRASYGKRPTQGTPIANAFDYIELHDQAAFMVIRCHLERIDLVELQDVHRRAVYTGPDEWTGQWLVP